MIVTSYVFYLISYFLASLFLYWAGSEDSKQNLIEGKSILKNLKRNIFILLSFGIVFFISGWRYGIGTDYFNYIDMYRYITSQGSIITAIKTFSNVEPGFIILNYLVKYFFNDERYIFIVCSFVTLFFIYKGIWSFKSKINIGFALFIYLLLFHNISFNAVRQFIAIAIVFYSMRYLFNRKLIMYLVFITIACSFHLTSIVMLPLYFIYGNNYIKKYNRIIIYGFLCFSLLILDSLVQNFFISSRYSDYISSNLYSEGGIGAFIVRLPLIFLLLIFSKDIVNYDKRGSFLINIIILELVLSLFGYKIEFFTRFLIQFNIIKVLLLPLLVKSISTRREAPIVLFVILLFIFYSWIFQLNGGITNDSVPYTNIYGWKF